MTRSNAGIVVTGGGSGIGAALARRFAAEGARVVVNDIDAGGRGGRRGLVRGDRGARGRGVADGVAALIAAARDELGEIDLYCANAGIVRSGGPETAEADWDASWQVNVMAHVRAARLLLGPWLERGSGHLICTVSAAGLLTMPGTASYSVTKHAALAFAEWMARHLRAPRPDRAGDLPAGGADRDARRQRSGGRRSCSATRSSRPRPWPTR